MVFPAVDSCALCTSGICLPFVGAMPGEQQTLIEKRSDISQVPAVPQLSTALPGSNLCC